MNKPLKKHIDDKGNKTYTGGNDPGYANRKTRRLPLQKSERNPLHGTDTHTHITMTPEGKGLLFKNYVQVVYDKWKKRFKRILHTRYLTVK